jgi:hypothetical protein
MRLLKSIEEEAGQFKIVELVSASEAVFGELHCPTHNW